MKLAILLALALTLAACDARDTAPRPASATNNVHVLPAMTIAGLERQRVIRVYLPPSYSTTSETYPVIYMHDGQNLFDDATSYAGEWGIDETLNKLAAETGLEWIVVGIDNGAEKRMNELSPWANEEHGAAEGDAYMKFIIGQVKPMVDATYRTKPSREHTAIVGSSMGGLISHYAVLAHSDVFSRAGIFSPSYWFSDEVTNFTRKASLPSDARVLLVMGGREGRDSIRDMNAMHDLLLDKGHPKTGLRARVVADGEHNEAFWRGEFAAAILWLYED